MNKAVFKAVEDRAGGRCEACGFLRRDLTLDHWEGGNGRRRQHESVETCWMLCTRCNRDRTENDPSAEFWNRIRSAHCDRYGYPYVPHLVKAPVNMAAVAEKVKPRILGDSFGELVKRKA